MSEKILVQTSNKKYKKFAKALFARKITIVSAVIVGIIIIVALFAPFIAPFDPTEMNQMKIVARPDGENLLGTDMYGRDVLTRLIYGVRVSLIIGVFAVVISCAIGTFLGLIAAYFGGIVDEVIDRIAETIRAVPNVILAMSLVAVFGGGIIDLAIVLGLSTIPNYIRMIRGQVMAMIDSDYIVASKLQGASHMRVMMKHILPNTISPIIVLMTQQIGSTILAEAGLSFLGLGVTAPTATWGSMVNEGKDFLLINPLYSLIPGICIALLVVSLNILGDGVRDALDPRLRGEI